MKIQNKCALDSIECGLMKDQNSNITIFKHTHRTFEHSVPVFAE